MNLDQPPETRVATFEASKRRLAGLAGLPLQIVEHAPTILAGLDTRTQETLVVPGQALGLFRQGRDQRLLPLRFDVEFHQLGETAIVPWRLHERSPMQVRRILRSEGVQGKTSS